MYKEILPKIAFDCYIKNFLIIGRSFNIVIIKNCFEMSPFENLHILFYSLSSTIISDKTNAMLANGVSNVFYQNFF